jgi:hypothetical protein
MRHGTGNVKAQLRDFDRIGQRADREIQTRRREKYDPKRLCGRRQKRRRTLVGFFFQHPSLLNFQQELKRKYKKNRLPAMDDGETWDQCSAFDYSLEEEFGGVC